VPLRGQYIRVMFSEITRLLNHLMWLGSHGHDCGASTMLLYTFREREDLFDMYEAVSGARMHAAYFRPGGVYRDLPDSMALYKSNKVRSARSLDVINANRQGSLLDFLEDFTRRFPGLTSTSTRRCSPTTASGSNAPWASAWSRPSVRSISALTGPMLRGSGVEWDLRRKQPYEVYDQHGISTYRSASDGRLLRPLPGARRGDARRPTASSRQCIDWLRKSTLGPGHRRQPQGGAAATRVA
jgi:NADH-quinone oxidoreductase subunit D